LAYKTIALPTFPIARAESGLIMNEVICIWDLEDDPEGNVQHIAEHGITQDEVASVFKDPNSVTELSRSTGELLTKGWTDTGRYVVVVWEHVDDDPLTVYPITAFALEPK
jgi:hypothetical protein